MIARMKNARAPRWIATAAAVLVLGACSGVVRAAPAADDDDVPDARLAGYHTNMDLGGGSAGAFALLGLLGAATVAVMFKSSNRSYLD